jgi:hypothetical protein
LETDLADKVHPILSNANHGIGFILRIFLQVDYRIRKAQRPGKLAVKAVGRALFPLKGQIFSKDKVKNPKGYIPSGKIGRNFGGYHA